jgi:hypothetical protein
MWGMEQMRYLAQGEPAMDVIRGSIGKRIVITMGIVLAVICVLAIVGYFSGS